MNDDDDVKGCLVLVVEDEAMLSLMLGELLTGIGCEVVASASRFADAERKCETLAFDVALLDVNLRGEQTFPIAEAMRQRGQAFVLATGYTSTILPESLRASPLLQKPYRTRDLEAALWDAMHHG